MTAHFRIPRAIAGRLMASASPSAVVAELHTAFNQFKGDYDAKWGNAQKAVDDLNAKIAALGMEGFPVNTADRAPPAEPEYTRAYATWLRAGMADRDSVSLLHDANVTGVRKEVMAAMSAGSATDGGYLAPTEWDRTILKALAAKSPMRRLATVVNTKVRAYQTLWNKEGWGSGWVGETAARPATATAQLDPVIFDHGEIYANPAITQQLLDDADYPLEDWIATELSDEFARQEGIAFISGNGVNKPRGLLTYITGGASETTHPGGPLVVVPTGNASTLNGPDTLIDFVYSQPAPYRQNAKWLMNSTTAAAVAKMKDGQGNYIWRDSYVAGQPSTLLGYAVEIDENMPSIAAGNLPIAFGDFRAGYVINDRYGVRLLRDPYTNKPYVHFYTTKRVGGGVRDPKAIRLLRVSAS